MVTRLVVVHSGCLGYVRIRLRLLSDHPKITQYSRSPSTRSLSVKQESPDSVHDMIDVAHAYIHHAVDQMYQSPPPLVNKPENLQNTKAMHAHHTKQAPK